MAGGHGQRLEMTASPYPSQGPADSVRSLEMKPAGHQALRWGGSTPWTENLPTNQGGTSKWWGNLFSYWLVYKLCTSCQCLWMIQKNLVLSSLGLFPIGTWRHEGCLKYPVKQTGQSYIKGSYSVMLLWKLASRTCCFNEWPCACMCMLHATICQLRVWRNGVACAKPLSSTRPILCDRRSEILPFPKNPEKDRKSHNGKSGNN